MPETTLIAIGGGGATHGTHPELDRLCLAHSCARPRIGFVGIASDDDRAQYRMFKTSIKPIASAVTRLDPMADGKTARRWAEGLDLVYLGGGDPVRLVRHLKATGIGAVLAETYRRGVPLAGVSAGAMCWFDSFLWRSPDVGLTLAPGLGLVSGSMTPHSLIEPERLIKMQDLVDGGAISEAWAVDDGAALIIQNGVASSGYHEDGAPRVHRFARSEPRSVSGV
ncbi:Type 1 glutamine amidotransferase-like domain-containing protein [Roseicyclus sp.]|uniref:Type 1 glutamine amidotransferase-like domain-containing protein n=1 Tax=Roseicyclus sp. TaxID=1914329 RepID=UPI003F6D11A4